MPTVEQSTGEIFFGLVGAVGTDLRAVYNALEESLLTLKFRSIEIGVSGLLQEVKSWKNVPSDLDDLRKKIPEGNDIPEDDRVTLLMDLGNMIRKMFNRGDALALLAVYAIGAKRVAMNKAANKKKRVGKRRRKDRLNPPLPRTGFILRSLKNPDEVSTLRRIYGRRFFLIAANSQKEKRLERLAQKIANSRDNPRWLEFKSKAEELSNRDEKETGERLGQNVRDTFTLADVFVDATDPNGDNLNLQVHRFVDLVFGNPLHTPSREEYGMFHAYAAASRSGALSRQVGASLTTEDGSVVSLGANEVPRAGGGFYWPGDLEDSRDLRKGFDQSDKMERAILTEILQHLEDQKWLAKPLGHSIDQLATFSTRGFKDALMEAKDIANTIANDKQAAKVLTNLVTKTNIDKQLREQIKRVINDIVRRGAKAERYLISLLEVAFSPPMKRARFTELTEYNRTVHAEAAALLEAARHGTFVKDCSLYSTTFPCHVCTRQIVVSGVRRVVYIEPYPKSYAEEQHGDAISVNKGSQVSKVSFVPFVGVAPRQYLPFFALDFFDRKRKDDDGNVVRWTSDDITPFREPPASYLNREIDLLDHTANFINANWRKSKAA